MTLLKFQRKRFPKIKVEQSGGSYDSDYIAAILMVHQLNKAIQMTPPPEKCEKEELNKMGKIKYWFIKTVNKYGY